MMSEEQIEKLKSFEGQWFGSFQHLLRELGIKPYVNHRQLMRYRKELEQYVEIETHKGKRRVDVVKKY